MSRLLLLSTAEKRYAAEQHAQGHTAEQLAESLNVPPAWVTDALRNPPPPKDDSRPTKPTAPKEPRRRAPNLTPEDKAEIVRLRNGGMRYHDIAKALGISYATAKAVIDTHRKQLPPVAAVLGYSLGAET